MYRVNAAVLLQDLCGLRPSEAGRIAGMMTGEERAALRRARLEIYRAREQAAAHVVLEQAQKRINGDTLKRELQREHV